MGAPGPLIGRGRAADVYDIGDGRVLRRNRSGAPTALEAAVMVHLHTCGYPVPRVLDASGPDLVMERVDGATMLERLPRQPWRLRAWAVTLADLHDRLVEIPLPETVLPAPFGPAETLVHGDLHPANVMLTDAGPVVIDWTNAVVGPRGTDVASTWIIMATSEVEGGVVARTFQAAARSWFVGRFLFRAGRNAAQPLLPVVAEHRLADRNLRPGEADNIRRLLAREGFSC